MDWSVVVGDVSVVVVDVVDSSVVVPFDEDDGSTVVCVCDCVRPGGGGVVLVVFVVAGVALWAWPVVVVFVTGLRVGVPVALVAARVVLAGLAGWA